MDSEGSKRHRSISFSAEEKLLIANICLKYKDIIENKKTDLISCDQKKKVWEKIAAEVNAAAVNTTYRSQEILKRFFENRKREVRKIAAEEKKELYGTGGGQPFKIRKDPCHDIILSIMNTKTVYGLANEIDGDTEPCPSLTDSDVPFYKENDHQADDIVIYEANENEEGTTWKKYTPANLKEPITANLKNFEDRPSCSKRKYSEDEIITPKKNKLLTSSRRRPTLHVKALSRSELAEKYDQLLDKRLEIAEFQKKKMEEELLTIEGERKLKFRLLELQIEVEKKKLASFSPM